jgi:hypothetical protein
MRIERVPFLLLLAMSVILAACSPAAARAIPTATPIPSPTATPTVRPTTIPPVTPVECSADDGWIPFTKIRLGVQLDKTEQAEVVLGKLDGVEPSMYVELREQGEVVTRIEGDEPIPYGRSAYDMPIDLVHPGPFGGKDVIGTLHLQFSLCRSSANGVYIYPPADKPEPSGDKVIG